MEFWKRPGERRVEREKKKDQRSVGDVWTDSETGRRDGTREPIGWLKILIEVKEHMDGWGCVGRHKRRFACQTVDGRTEEVERNDVRPMVFDGFRNPHLVHGGDCRAVFDQGGLQVGNLGLRDLRRGQPRRQRVGWPAVWSYQGGGSSSAWRGSSMWS